MCPKDCSCCPSTVICKEDCPCIPPPKPEPECCIPEAENDCFVEPEPESDLTLGDELLYTPESGDSNDSNDSNDY